MSDPLRQKGLEAVRRRQFYEGIEPLSRYVLTADERDLEPRLALAIAYSAIGDDERALVVLERLTKARPNSPNLHFQHGRILQRVGRADAAKIAFRRVLQLKPTHTRAQQRLSWLMQPSLAPVMVEQDDELQELEAFEQELVELDEEPLVELEAVGPRDFLAEVDDLFGTKNSSPARRPARSARPTVQQDDSDEYDPRGPSGTPWAWIFVPLIAAAIVAIGVVALWPKDGSATATSASTVEGAITQLQSQNRYEMYRALDGITRLTPDERREEVSIQLEKLLADSELFCRLEAARAAKTWGTKRLIPALRRLAESDSPTVRKAGEEAITAIEARP